MARRRRQTRRDEITRRSLPRFKASSFPTFTSPGFSHVRGLGRPSGRLQRLRREAQKVVGSGNGYVTQRFSHNRLVQGSLSLPSSRRVVPSRVLSVCGRRRVREEVLHATGKSGRSGQRRPRYTVRSKVRCK